MLKYKRRVSTCLLFLVVALVCGCASSRVTKKEVVMTAGPQENSFDNPNLDIRYDVQMLAAVISVDTQAGIVVFQETKTGQSYTLTYTGATQIFDKYNEPMSMAQVKSGDLVQAYYYQKKVQLTGICYRNDTWEYKETTDWKVDTEEQTITVNGEQYYYKDGISLLSSGSEVEFRDLNKQDTLSVFGKDKQVLSVRIDRGHGYIRPSGLNEFIGGWIEIGKIIKPVTDGMLIVAPEGTYDVKIVKDGFGGTLSAKVERDRETNVDFTDIGARAIRYGTIEFSITPEDAKLYIAGKETDYSSQVILEYDTYRIAVKADGYENYTGDLKVSQNLAKIKINLEASTTSSPSPSPTPTLTPTATPVMVTAVPTAATASDNITSSTYKINVTGPDGASVYFDDAYVGTVPASFAKTSGTHTLTLSLSGYKTKSYTIEVGTEPTDVTFALPDLVAE